MYLLLELGMQIEDIFFQKLLTNISIQKFMGQDGKNKTTQFQIFLFLTYIIESFRCYKRMVSIIL